jgi:hypothetical protein
VGNPVAYKIHGQKAFPCVAIDWLAANATWAVQSTAHAGDPQAPWPHCQESPKTRTRLDRRKGQTRSIPKKAKGALEDALQKLEKLVRTRLGPLALKDLVMKAHVPFPFDR